MVKAHDRIEFTPHVKSVFRGRRQTGFRVP